MPHPLSLKSMHCQMHCQSCAVRPPLRGNAAQVALKLSPRLSVFRYSITQSQNLKASVGFDFASDLATPFTKV